ncbi:MAG: twin-arginine translocase subunit TatC, partial [Candidatus Thermoplasmatota archaeon]|nr:twin-arginine translocase subunit TatC [Candidatus Thermoplasmatota archaeon]
VLLSDLFRAAARGSTPAMKEAVAAVRGRVNLGALALLVLSAVGLAGAGLLYASTGLVPLLLDYLTNDAQAVGLSTDWRLIAYVSFLVRLHLASAVGFQAPLVTLAVLRGGLVDRSTLVAHRRHVWFGCVVMGAFVSPPDPLSLFLVALPVVFLFEVGLIIDRLFGRAPASA